MRMMLTAITLFSINDALGKWLLATYSVGELLLIRSAAALILLVPFIRQAGPADVHAGASPRAADRARDSFLARSRDVLLGGASCRSRNRDFQPAGPIYVTALSVIRLGEKSAGGTWTAVVVGFDRRIAGVRRIEAMRASPGAGAELRCIGSVLRRRPPAATRRPTSPS